MAGPMMNSTYRTMKGARNHTADRPCPGRPAIGRWDTPGAAGARCAGGCTLALLLLVVAATANLLWLPGDQTGDGVSARTDSLEWICARAASADSWPASTAPMDAPITF